MVQCVDNSGQWGSGGVFSALSSRSVTPEQQYELAGDMKDLNEGDVHLIHCSDVSDYDDYNVALLVAQGRNLKVKPSALSLCLMKLGNHCKADKGLSVHLPRLGYNTPGFDWYSTERQLRKYLSNRRVHTYVYYYKRKQKRRLSSSSSNENDNQKKTKVDVSSTSASVPHPSTSAQSVPCVAQDGPLENILSGLNFVIDSSIGSAEKRNLKRYIIAFDGDLQTFESGTTDYVVTVEPVDCSYGQAVMPQYVFDSICCGTPLPSGAYMVK